MMYIIIAILLGYYLGSSSQRREDLKKISTVIKNIKVDKNYKIIKKDETGHIK